MLLSKPVSSIMTVQPVVAHQFHNFSQILRLFTEFPVHHLPVMNSKNKLAGIVSSNDLQKVFMALFKSGDKFPMDMEAIDKAINITDIMTPNPVTISSTDSIGMATRIFAEKQFMALPVVDNNELVGILSMKDIISYLASHSQNEVGNKQVVESI